MVDVAYDCGYANILSKRVSKWNIARKNVMGEWNVYLLLREREQETYRKQEVRDREHNNVTKRFTNGKKEEKNKYRRITAIRVHMKKLQRDKKRHTEECWLLTHLWLTTHVSVSSVMRFVFSLSLSRSSCIFSSYYYNKKHIKQVRAWEQGCLCKS